MSLTVTVNGEVHQEDGDLAGCSLLTLIRDRFGLLGTKNACEQGECGSCTVWVDDVLVNACLVPAAQADRCSVTTIEGLTDPAGPAGPVGRVGSPGGAGDEPARPHPVQRAFLETGAIQCGFCTPGMVVAATDLLRRVPRPTAAVVRREMAGNLCRCTGYQRIVEAVLLAADLMAADDEHDQPPPDPREGEQT